jgi:hypothetical protein
MGSPFLQRMYKVRPGFHDLAYPFSKGGKEQESV